MIKFGDDRLPQRFWDKVSVNDETGCWEWTAAVMSNGYGAVRWEGKTCYSHRLAYSVLVEDPGDLHVCHTCDNPPCVNPEHLFAGSYSDNANDMVKKGRGTSILSVDEVQLLRDHFRQGIKLRIIADEFGVSVSSVSNIALGRTYKHVPNPCQRRIIKQQQQ